MSAAGKEVTPPIDSVDQTGCQFGYMLQLVSLRAVELAFELHSDTMSCQEWVIGPVWLLSCYFKCVLSSRLLETTGTAPVRGPIFGSVSALLANVSAGITACG